MKTQEYTPALGYDKLSDMYDLAIKLTMPEKQFRKKLVDHLSPQAGERILEFGFGTGANLLIASQHSPDSEFSGLDIDPKIHQLAQKKLTINNIKANLELYNGEIFPFESNSFDKVYSCLVFHHLDKEAKTHSLKEIFRVLKPGGTLIIGDWGKAKSRLMRIMFYTVQLLDGFKTTTDNVKGLLPEYIKKAGFSEAKETGFINTRIGTFSYYQGLKQK